MREDEKILLEQKEKIREAVRLFDPGNKKIREGVSAGGHENDTSLLSEFTKESPNNTTPMSTDWQLFPEYIITKRE